MSLYILPSLPLPSNEDLITFKLFENGSLRIADMGVFRGWNPQEAILVSLNSQGSIFQMGLVANGFWAKDTTFWLVANFRNVKFHKTWYT